jgi:hypothetical protein
MEGLSGLTAIETRTPVTVSVVVPVIPVELSAAMILVVPGLTAVARPPLAIVAAVALDELQVAELVKTCVLPSL